MQKIENHKTLFNILIAATWIVLALLPISFLLAYKDNLHCTQYTSFRIALLDMEPHVEETIPVPLIYRSPFAMPLRIYFGCGLLFFFFAPIVSGMLFISDKLPAKKYFGGFLYIAGYHVVNILLSLYLAGERFTALYVAAGLYCCILYPMYIAAAVVWRGKLQESPVVQ